MCEANSRVSVLSAMCPSRKGLCSTCKRGNRELHAVKGCGGASFQESAMFNLQMWPGWMVLCTIVSKLATHLLGTHLQPASIDLLHPVLAAP